MEKVVSELTVDASTQGFPLIQLDLIESTELPNKHCWFCDCHEPRLPANKLQQELTVLEIKQGNLPSSLPPPLFFSLSFFPGYPTSRRACTGCQSAPFISSHMALRSVSLTAHSSNWRMVLLLPKGYPGGLFSRWGAGGRGHNCAWLCTSVREWEHASG